ncbi:MAG: hypothetical protein WC382_04265 [Methanoregulaceae archaeon]
MAFLISETLKQVQYGHNKEHDRLPQLNLAQVFGQESNLPFFYRKLAGTLVYIRKKLDVIYDTFRSFEHHNENHERYCRTVRTTWNYSQERPTKGDALQESRRLYIHYYNNIDKAEAEDEKDFDRRLFALKQELESGKRVPEHEKLYQQYFTIKTTPRRRKRVQVNGMSVNKAKRYYGFFAPITNETMDAVTTLELYRNKDVVEKAFGNLKERLNMRRALVSSEQSLDGKLFVQFVALIYLSCIKKQMQVKGLLKDYTLPGLLDNLDVIECFEQPGRSLRVGEILDKQEQLYYDLGVVPPTSLCVGGNIGYLISFVLQVHRSQPLYQPSQR